MYKDFHFKWETEQIHLPPLSSETALTKKKNPPETNKQTKTQKKNHKENPTKKQKTTKKIPLTTKGEKWGRPRAE